MLLYSTLWTSRHYSCPSASCAPIYVQLDSFNTEQMHGMDRMHSRKEISFSIHSPPLRLRPRRLFRESGSDRLRLRQLRITATVTLLPVQAASTPLPKYCSPRVNQLHHTSERGSSPGDDARPAETCRILAWARAYCICWMFHC